MGKPGQGKTAARLNRSRRLMRSWELLIVRLGDA